MNHAKQLAHAITAMLILALFTSGCATETLWEEQSYHPAANSDLSLMLDPKRQDLLVQYTEQHGETKEFRRRAYWLFASTNRVSDHAKPVFVKPKADSGLIAIPLLDKRPATNAQPISGYVAMAISAPPGFDLWRDGNAFGRYYLPIYFVKPKRTVGRIFATPFAAAGDTIIVIVVVAAVAAAVVGVLYLESQSDTPFPN